MRGRGSWVAAGLGDAGAAAAGFVSVTVACEPTGHRWRVLDQLAGERGLPLVCVQPLLVYRARESEDVTFDKSDPKDAVIIARLAAGLHCYEPERADAVWARLRHRGARRTADHRRDGAGEPGPGSAGMRLARGPGRVRRRRFVRSWRAALAVALDRSAGDLTGVRGWARPGSSL